MITDASYDHFPGNRRRGDRPSGNLLPRDRRQGRQVQPRPAHSRQGRPIRSLAIAALVLAANGAGAQDSPAPPSRFSIAINAGPSVTSPVFKQETEAPGVPGETFRRYRELSLDRAMVPSARISYRLIGPWLLSAEAGIGSTQYSHVDSTMTLSGTTSAVSRWRGDARQSFVSLGIGREISVLAGAVSLEPELAYVQHRLRIGTEASCPPPPSSAAPPTPLCRPSERWERAYTVRSVETAVTLGYAVARHLAIQVRGQYSTGRASTREGFWTPLAPQFAYLEAPTTQWIRAGRLSFGLSLRP